MFSFFCFSINRSSSELRQLLPVSHIPIVCVCVGWQLTWHCKSESCSVVSVQYGIRTLSLQIFGGSPNIALSGPNVGTDIRSGSNGPSGSGTMYVYYKRTTQCNSLMPTCSFDRGAACESANEDMPSIAFSGQTGSQVSFTTLSNPFLASSIALQESRYSAVENFWSVVSMQVCLFVPWVWSKKHVIV